MKPAQIIFLVGAGALGGAVLTTTVWHKPQASKQAAVAEAPQPAAAAATVPAVPPAQAAAPADPEPVATEPEAAAAQPEKPSPLVPETRKPSPVAAAPRREPPMPRPTTRHAPPPANPRPVETARVEPKTVPAPQPAPASVAAPEPAPNPPAQPEPEHVTQAPPPPPPATPTVTLNSGMLLSVRLIDGLSSERNLAGDTFTGTLDRELVADGFVIAERGARVEGRVANVDRGGKTRGVAAMAIELTRIHTSDGQTVPIQTDAFERPAEASRQTDAAKVGGGAAIGAIAGGGKGAAIGAGVGGGAGAGDVLLTRGKPVTFPTETRVSFRLRAPVTLTERR